MISAKVVEKSINPQKDVLTTFEVVFPTIILPEVLTHREFSRNTSSLRAIPFEKVAEEVLNNPFVPLLWQKPHRGMQGDKYLTPQESLEATKNWIIARDKALAQAKLLDKSVGVTKQLSNRLLSPFMWTKMLITTSEQGLQNFFDLRCPMYGDSAYGLDKCSVIFKSKKEYCKHFNIEEDYQTPTQWQGHNYSQAEIHIQALAEQMYDAFKSVQPLPLKEGDYHIPYKGMFEIPQLIRIALNNLTQGKLHYQPTTPEIEKEFRKLSLKVSVAMAARVSYTTIGDEKDLDYNKLIRLHDKLIELRHDSPLEHVARAMTSDEYYTFSRGQDGKATHEHGWCKNLKGFINYRYTIEHE